MESGLTLTSDKTQWPHVVMLLQVCADQGHVSSSWVHAEIIDLYNSERATFGPNQPLTLTPLTMSHSLLGSALQYLKVRGVTPEVSEPWLGLGFSPRSSPR